MRFGPWFLPLRSTRGSGVAYLELERNDPTAVSTSVQTKPKKGSTATAVRTVNLVDWLREMAALPMLRGAPIVIRMDIEGAEYAVLQDLVTSGAPATLGNRLLLLVEWHRGRKRQWPEGRPAAMARIDRDFGGLNAAATFRQDCMLNPTLGGCRDWFGFERQSALTPGFPAPSLEKSKDNLNGLTSLYENFEKSMIHWLLLANVTYCEAHTCYTWSEMVNVPVEKSGESSYSRFVLRHGQPWRFSHGPRRSNANHTQARGALSTTSS